MKYTAEKAGQGLWNLYRGDVYIATVQASSKEEALNQVNHCMRETSNIRHLINR